jgi:dTDP-4-amino-4,6-dideoxygalactose transaminase
MELALLGGPRVRTKLFPAMKVIGPQEVEAARKVAETGILSRYLGTWHPDFYGGPQVQAFEKEWAAAFGVGHAVAMNSATSGLYAAIGATGVGPGDEVIVSPYTMTASAVAPLIFNAIPVFADIDPETYTLSPESVASRITARTKAIIVVHIFGQPADMDPLMALADRHGLTVIEDCAQSPFAAYKGRPVGAVGHMGVFSLNYHKHIHTGEGCLVTTNSDRLAERLQLIRNHGEAVVEAKGVTDIINILGFNLRLGEIEAAIGRSLLGKGPGLVQERQAIVDRLERGLRGIPGLGLPVVRPGCTHSYYIHALDFDRSVTGVRRQTFVKALKAELAPTELREHEGVLMGEGYVRPLYLQPLYQKRIAYGDKGCPFTCPHYEGDVDYSPGICPNAERAYSERVITHELMRPPMTESDVEDVIRAFHKVAENLEALRAWEMAN